MKTPPRSLTFWPAALALLLASSTGMAQFSVPPQAVPQAPTPSAPPPATGQAPNPTPPSSAAPVAPSGPTIYRITMPDGRVVLTDRPPEKTTATPANAKVETLKTAPPPSPQEAAEAQQRLQRYRAANERASQNRRATAQAEAQRDASVAAARQRLTEAEARAQAAATPGPGDFMPLAGGGTRLSDAYQARQTAAAAEVAAARAALDAAMTR